MIAVGVIGACGKMGKMIIENILKHEGLTLSSAFDRSHIGKDVGEIAQIGKLGVLISDISDIQSVLKETNTKVVIDFTIAKATIENVPKVAECGVNLVIGTTGFSDKEKVNLNEVILKNNISAIISPNYSVGVNVFFNLLKEASKQLSDNDIEIIEIHHNQKKDAPSGTALKAANIINEVISGNEFVYGREGMSLRGKEIGIHAVRGGDVVGDHTVIFMGNGERIEIKHQAHTRATFASGAVKAAYLICNKKPKLYSMEELFSN